ncbi:MAG: hypothetical protein ACOYNC_11255 [Bacteroidales bacterium]
MERIFSFRRFGLLFIRHGYEHLKIYAMAWGVITLVIIFISVISKTEGTELTGMYPLMLCLTGAIMTSTLFSPWTNFGKSSFYLLLPATSAEKFLSGLVYSLLLFIPIFTILYFTCGIFFIKIFHPDIELKNIFNEISQLQSIRIFSDIFMAFLFIQAITLIGTIGFKSRQLIISILLVVILFLFFSLSTFLLMKGFTGTYVSTWLHPFFNYGFGIETGANHTGNMKYFHFTHVINNLNYLVWTIVIILVYLSAWFKLREREL